MKESNTIKTVKDYIPELQQHFPELAESDIKRIVEYGWRMLYMGNVSGCDTLITSTKYSYWFYIGNLCNSALKHFEYYKKKLFRKIKFLYTRIKPKWDEYYYVSLTDEEYLELKKRKKKKYQFKNKRVFKTKDACNLAYSGNKYIIRYKSKVDLGFNYYFETLNCEYPEIVLEKDKPDTFKDILKINNNYNFL